MLILILYYSCIFILHMVPLPFFLYTLPSPPRPMAHSHLFLLRIIHGEEINILVLKIAIFEICEELRHILLEQEDHLNLKNVTVILIFSFYHSDLLETFSLDW